MDKGADFVHKNQNLFLEDLSYFSEMSYIAKSENSAFLFSFDHRIHFSFLYNVGTNNFSTCTTENSREKCTNFNDSVTNDGGFKLNVAIQLFFCSTFWVLSHLH